MSKNIHLLVNLLDTKILTKNDWTYFKEQFTELFPSFFTHLKIKGLNLTNSEERLLALEHLNLNNEEIASRLGIAERSVIVSRYRLKKKLEIPKEVSLLDYLK